MQETHRLRSLVWLTVNSSYSHSSLSLPLIHAQCKHIPGWQWHHVERTVAEDVQEVIRNIEMYQPDLLCVPLYIFNRKFVQDLLKRYHALKPDCPVAVGDPECLDGENVLEEMPFLRAVFRGEGEETFAMFLRDFDNPAEHAVFSETGSFVWEKTVFPVNDPFFSTEKAFVQYETSRGCPMGCTYCTSGNTGTRFKDPELVQADLTALRHAGVREIRLLDRTFNLPPERCAGLLRMFREKFPDMKFHLELHPQFLHEKIREEMRQAPPGQLHVEAGVQSLTPCVQRAIGRNSSREQTLSGLKFLCSCKNFATHTDLLSGLPEQHFDDLVSDVEILMQTGPEEIQLEVLKILPGTVLKREAEQLGLIYAPDAPYDVMATPTMTTEEILLSRKLSRLLDLTYNHPALHPVLRKMDGIRRLFDFALEKGLAVNSLYDLKKRFLLLTEFLSADTGMDETVRQNVQFELAQQWLFAGYPPEQTPVFQPERCSAAEIKSASLIYGDESCKECRETKFYRLRYGGTDLIFSFNRTYACNLPAAVWRNNP